MATATKSRKSASEKRSKAAPPSKDKPAPEASGKAAKPIPDENTRVLESWPRIKKLEDNYTIASGELMRAETALDDARERVKVKQGMVDELNATLHAIYDEIRHPEKHPLFNAGSLPNGKAPSADVQEDDAWKAVPIRDALLGLGKRAYDGLDKSNLKTLGQFCDWRNKNDGMNWVTNIEGVGNAVADKIDDAMDAFLTKWRKEHPPKQVQAPATPASESATIKEVDPGKDAKAPAPPAKPTEPLKSGNSSAPAGEPLVPTMPHAGGK